MKSTPIGIIGVGMVGGAYARWFAGQGYPVFRFDTNGIGSPEEVDRAGVVLIAVPTPFDEASGRFDGSAVEAAVSGLGGSKTVIVKSTVLPGTTESLQARYPAHRFLFVPEFLTESSADADVASPRMNVVGYTAASRAAAPAVMELFARAPFERIMPSGEAEFFKYFRNVFFATKVVFSNQLYDLCRALGLDYDRIRECAAADPWLGGQHTAIWHQGYRGYGGKCLAAHERLHVFNNHRFKIIPARDINAKVSYALGWENGRLVRDRILYSGIRTVRQLIRFVLRKGRTLTVTPDHVMVVSDATGRLTEKRAHEVTPRDYLPVVLAGLPPDESDYTVKFAEEVKLPGRQIFVGGVPRSFAGLLRPYLTHHQYKELKRTRREVAVPLEACRKAGIAVDPFRIKTGKTGSWVPAAVRVDERFARLIGYYLAEGCVSDGRVLISFGAHEHDLLDDMRSVLRALNIPFSTMISYWRGHASAYTFKISSNILAAWFIQWGAGSRDKQVPPFIFHTRPPVRDSVLAGLFRGDGSIFRSNQGNYYTVNIATASQLLAEGVDALLRAKGILASIGRIRTAKTKSLTWSLDISESQHLALLLPLFTERQRSKVLPGSVKAIRSPAYRRVKNLALLGIRVIEQIRRTAEVVSLETQRHRYVTSWGIITHNCLPKDTRAFIRFSREHGVEQELLERVEEINRMLTGGESHSA